MLILIVRDDTLEYMRLIDEARMDKSTFSIGSLAEGGDEMQYWQSTTPEQRLAAVELMRQILYGYDPATTRLQRVLSVTQREED